MEDAIKNPEKWSHLTLRLKLRYRFRSCSFAKSIRKTNLFQMKIQNEDIALKLRPTLPKKQLEIPRFSPSAAWRLLSALETPGPTMSTASEEMPVSIDLQ